MKSVLAKAMQLRSADFQFDSENVFGRKNSLQDSFFLSFERGKEGQPKKQT